MADHPSELERLRRENADLRERAELLERSGAEDSAFLRTVLGAVPAFILRVGADLKIRYLNRYRPGYRPDDVIGRDATDFMPPDRREQFLEAIERVRKTGQPTTIDNAAAGPNGELAHYQTHISPVPEPGGVGVCLVAIDVTDDRKREAHLRENEARLRLLLEATGLGLWSWDLVTGEVEWEDGMRELHGMSDPVPALDYGARCVHPDDRASFDKRVRAVIEHGHWESAPHRILRPDGSVRWVLPVGRVTFDDGKPVSASGGLVDITLQRELEEQLRQAQKMEAIGSLTAGIAHNFNNLLTVILPTLDLASRVVPPERVMLLREATHAARRAAEMIHQLMTYSGQSRSHERVPSGLDTVVEAAVGICRRAFDPSVRVETRYEGPPPTVLCNAVQLEQVLVNLLLNARDAVLEKREPSGYVRVRVSSAARELARIEVSDNGVGIAPEQRARVFEPFFTTKPTGRGTGLGLATSFGIVRDHGGTIACESVPGGGTTFTLTLPLSHEAKLRSERPTMLSVRKGARVLLVDDDEAVRTAIACLLGEAELCVRIASSGEDALALLDRDPAVDAILLDRSMPTGAGERYIAGMRARAPGVRVLFLSGQSIEPEVARLADGLVHKPVTGVELFDAIERALAAAEPSRA